MARKTKKKIIEYKIDNLILSIPFSEKFIILTIIERYMIEMYSCIHTKSPLFLLDF
jgi:hypothetical protein